MRHVVSQVMHMDPDEFSELENENEDDNENENEATDGCAEASTSRPASGKYTNMSTNMLSICCTSSRATAWKICPVPPVSTHAYVESYHVSLCPSSLQWLGAYLHAIGDSSAGITNMDGSAQACAVCGYITQQAVSYLHCRQQHM